MTLAQVGVRYLAYELTCLRPSSRPMDFEPWRGAETSNRRFLNLSILRLLLGFLSDPGASSGSDCISLYSSLRLRRAARLLAGRLLTFGDANGDVTGLNVCNLCTN